MDEYIKRSAIKYEQWAVGPLNAPLMVVRKKTVDAIPAADVVEVVRCKDCKHCIGPVCYNEHWESVGCPSVQPDDFCSYGERKGGDG